MYASGESAHLKKKRKRTRFFVPILWGLLALHFLTSLDTAMGVAFLLLAVVWLAFYPVYAKWLHSRHFRAHIEENYKAKTNAEGLLKIEEEGLFSGGSDGEGIVRYSAIERLIELESLFLVCLKTGTSLILPKARLAQNQLEAFLAEVSRRTGLEVLDQTDWRWR